MKSPIPEIQAALAKALNALPDVFSTVQWGGRAYKLPGPGSRGTRKPVLLAHICIEKDELSISIGFKLEPKRAKAMMRQHKWITPHSFRTLAPSGWIVADVRTMAQCKTVIALLRESRAAHPVAEPALSRNATARGGKRASVTGDDSEAKRIDAVLRRKREEGWKPREDAFAD